MGLNLSNLFSYNNNSTNAETKGSGAVVHTDTSEAARNYKMASHVLSLTAGSNITGEVVSVNGKEIQIALGNDMVLSARMEKNMDIVLGQLLTFEVQSAGADQIALRPLLTNMATDQTMLKALTAASLPITDQTTGMVSNMMQEGMSIDKNTLLSMYRQILDNPEVAGETIVLMNRLHLETTPANIEQFSAYKNFEHQLVNGIETIASEFEKMINSLLLNGKTEEALQLTQKFVTLLQGGEVAPVVAESASVQDLALMEDVFIQKNITLEDGELMLQNAKTSLQENAVMPVGAEAIQQTTKELISLLEEFPLDNKVLQELKDAPVNTRQLLQMTDTLLQKALSNKTIPEQDLQAFKQELQKIIQDLFSSKDFSKIIKAEIAQEWLLKPEEIGKEGKITEFYKSLQEQNAKLLDLLSSVAKEQPDLYKAVVNVQNNVEFMNQLNQAFTYVQLPLKMSQQNVHGELYVYTNKKNLAENDGNVSAFLHLDMEHVGPVDVYVAMQNQNVKTKFYLQNDEMIQFIGEHIHLLNERLESRGYTMNSEILNRKSLAKTNSGDEKPQSAFEQILNSEGERVVMLSKKSFDVRA